jgi:hypothetical protein
MKKLCFGTFAQVLRLCKRANLTDYELVGTMTQTIDPECQYANSANGTQVSRLLSCTGNLSDGKKRGGSGAHQKPGDSISRVVLNAPYADRNDIIRKFAENVVPLIDEDKKTLAVLALLDIIQDDADLDGDKQKSFEKYARATKKALLSQGEFALADLLAGLFLYAVSEVKNTSGRDCIQDITAEYVKTFAYRIDTLKIIDSFERTKFNGINSNQTEQSETYAEYTSECVFSEDIDEAEAPKTKNRIVNNPVVFNQYGNNNIQIEKVSTLTINNAKGGEDSD